MNYRILFYLCFLYFLFGRSGIAFGQTFEPATGVGLPQTAFDGLGIERVDLMSGSLSINIPLLSLPGRGLATEMGLSYSSKVWETDTVTFTEDDDQVDTAYFVLPDVPFSLNSNGTPNRLTDLLWGQFSVGWNIGPPRLGGISSFTQNKWDAGGGTYWELDTETWRTLDGAMTPLTNSNGFFYYDYAGDPITGPLQGLTCLPSTGTECIDGPFWAYDNSYGLVAATSSLSSKMIYNDGVSAGLTLVNDTTLDGESLSLEDTNGNTITCVTTTCTDTIGRKFVLSTNADGQIGNLEYVDSDGNQRNAAIEYTAYNLKYYFFTGPAGVCTLAGQIEDGCVYNSLNPAAYLPTKLTLADGATYKFDYVLNWDGSSTGEIAKLTLPGGGYVRYVYGIGPLQPYVPFCYLGEMTVSICQGRGENRVVTDRFVSSDGTTTSEQHWSYSIRQPVSLADGPNAGAAAVASTVTKPNGEQEITIFQDGDYLGQYTLPAIPAILREETLDAQSNVLFKKDNTVGYENSAYDVFDFFAHGPGYGLNNPRITTSTISQSGSTQKSQTAYSYSAYGNLHGVTNYDWSDSGTDVVLSRSANTFLADTQPAYANSNHILDRPLTTAIYDSTADTCNGIAAACAVTSYSYDEFGLQGTTSIASHDYTNFSSGVQTLRGNLTTKSQWLNTSGGGIASHYYYDDLGNKIQMVDPNGQSTYYAYDDNFTAGNPASQATKAFVTTITKPPTSGFAHISRYQYYFNAGKVAARCGENFPSSTACSQGLSVTRQSSVPDYKSYTYDGLFRPNCVALGDGGASCVTYNDTTVPLSATEVTVEDPASVPTGVVRTTTYDGLGRNSSSVAESDPDGASKVATSYDVLSRVFTVSNPYRTAADATYGDTQLTYDALSRKLSSTHYPDGTSQSWQYTGSYVDSWDEAGVHWKRDFDSLGRLKQVLELGTTSLPLSLETDYTYDALGNLVTVSQLGNGSEISRTRNFQYDSLSRLLWSSNPESGITCYGSGDGTQAGCQTDGYDPNGNLLHKTNMGSVRTDFAYDFENRLVSKSYYNDPSAAARTCYQYDGGGSANGTVNALGRLVNEWTQKGTTSCSSTLPSSGILSQKSIVSYDAVGRPTKSTQCVLNSCMGGGEFIMVQGYDLAGNLTWWTDGLRRIAFTEKFDGAGHPSSLTSSWYDKLHPETLFSAHSTQSNTSGCGTTNQASYSPSGSLQSWTLGNNLNVVRGYDSRLRVICENAVAP